MPTYNKVTISAAVIVLLSLLIISFPSAEGSTVAGHYMIRDMRLTLSWGDTANNMPSGSGATIWDGSLTLSGGTIKVLHQLQFKDANDRIIDKDGETVHFQSDIHSDYDGLQLRLFPNRLDSNPTLYFDSKTTGRVAFPLTQLVGGRILSQNLNSTGSILMELGDVNLNKGSLQEQVDMEVAKQKALCTTSGSISTNDCLSQMNLKEKIMRYESTIKKLSALTLEKNNAESDLIATQIHPDYLNFLGKKDLLLISRASLAKYDFSKLSYLSLTLYEYLKLTAPEILPTLSPALQQRVMVLEGLLDSRVATAVNLSSNSYDIIQQIMKHMNELERTRLSEKLPLLSPARWEEMKHLTTEDLTYALHMLAVTENTALETSFKAYIAQLNRIRTLLGNFHQIETFLSTAESNLVKESLASVQGTLVDDNIVSPSLFRQFEVFFSEVSVLSKTDREKALRLLMSNLKLVLTQSTNTKVSDGSTPFLDSKEDAWYHAYVYEAYQKKIVSGYMDKKGNALHIFAPEDNVSVAEVLKMAFESAGIGGKEGTPTHKEAQSHWAKAYVKQGEDMHLSILAKSTIDLNRPATRAEVIRTIFESYAYLPSETSTFDFSDVKADTPGVQFIYYAKNLGIISGDDGTTLFRPYDPINRAEVAKIFVNTLLSFKAPLTASTVEGDLDL